MVLPIDLGDLAHHAAHHQPHHQLDALRTCLAEVFGVGAHLGGVGIGDELVHEREIELGIDQTSALTSKLANTGTQIAETLEVRGLALQEGLSSRLSELETIVTDRGGQLIDAFDTKTLLLSEALDSRLSTLDTTFAARIDSMDASLGERISTMDSSLGSHINTLDLTLDQRTGPQDRGVR